MRVYLCGPNSKEGGYLERGRGGIEERKIRRNKRIDIEVALRKRRERRNKDNKNFEKKKS